MSSDESDPSCTIYISGIKNSFKFNEFKRYLESFGEYKEICRIYSDAGKRPDYTTFRVTFNKAEDARKVLVCEGQHDFFKTNIKVSATQPPTNQREREYRMYTGPIDPEQSPIYKLNNDCLLHLFSLLDLRDQYTLSRLCERFAEVFGRVFLKKDMRFFDRKILRPFVQEKLVSFYDREILKPYIKITRNEWWNLLEDYGHLVEFLALRANKNDFKYMSIYCPNLKSMTIFAGYYCSFAKDFVKTIGHLKLINSLDLQSLSIGDDVVQCLSRIDSLEELRLTCCPKITGKHFESFQNLRTLSVSLCLNVKPKYLQEMCESSPALALTTLDLFNSAMISNKTIQKIGDHCHNLRELLLGTNFKIDCIARLPNLEKLVTYFTDNVKSVFPELVTHAKHRLRVLELLSEDNRERRMNNVVKKCICKLTALEELHFKGIQIDHHYLEQLSASLPNLKCLQATNILNNEAIICFIRSAPKLERFYISEGQNNPELVSSIINALKEKQPALGKPFSLTLGDCRDKEHYRSMRTFIFPNRHIIRYDSWYPRLTLDDLMNGCDNYDNYDYHHYYPNSYDHDDNQDDSEYDEDDEVNEDDAEYKEDLEDSECDEDEKDDDNEDDAEYKEDVDDSEYDEDDDDNEDDAEYEDADDV